jgi:hypothetical protein
MRAVAVERRRHRVLHRARAAQPSVGEFLDRRQRGIEARRPAHRHPARAPSRREVGLRQARVGNDRRILIEEGHRRHRPVIGEVSIHFVRQDHQAVLLGDVDQRPPHLVGIDRASGVVRIDHHQRASLRCDDALEVLEIRLPPVGVIGPVVHRGRADLRQHRGVQRIGGRGHEHLLAFVHDGGQRELDAFRGAGGDQHAIGGGLDAAPGEVGGHRLASLDDARRRGIAVVSIAHGPGHGFDQVRRRQETELIRVADVEVADLLPRRLHLPGLDDDVANGVGEAVDTLRGTNRGGSSGHGETW